MEAGGHGQEPLATSKKRGNLRQAYIGRLSKCSRVRSPTSGDLWLMVVVIVVISRWRGSRSTKMFLTLARSPTEIKPQQ